ncbi:MAG: tol-pal system protein YbgF [Magnetococcales bacterium]|nr:tol-pal system protein YbgF [Magnetococcales bacterium]
MSMPQSTLSRGTLFAVIFWMLGGCTIGVQPPASDGSTNQPAAQAPTQANTPPVANWQQELTGVQGQIKKMGDIQNKALASVENRLALLEKEVNELRGELDVARRDNLKLSDRLVQREKQSVARNIAAAPPPPQPFDPPAAVVAQPAKPAVIQPAQPPAPAEPEITPIPTVPEDAPMPASAREAYEAAFLKLRSGKYQASLEDFSQFLKWFPNDSLADNAQYWIGELYYVQKQYPEALQAFNTVLVKWPDSTKIPACLLKIGFAFYELGDMVNAKASLSRLLTDHPDSNAVSLAKQRLQMINNRAAGQ